MTTKNDVTGDSLISKANTVQFNNGYDTIDWSQPLNEVNGAKNGQQRESSVSSRLHDSTIGFDGNNKTDTNA